MYMQMMKIGALAIVVAVLGYIFIPGNAKTDKTQAKKEQTAPIASQPAKSETASAKSKRTKKPQQEVRIEPDTTLRKEGAAARRSGPPSKMYGGL